MGSSKTTGRRDRAADTVIGFVLVTGISLLMITVVTILGTPALEQVRSRQQTDSMVGSFQRLDRSVTTLLSGAPSGSAPTWQVSMADGSLTVDDGPEQVWVYAAEIQRNNDHYQFWFGDYADGDRDIEIYYDAGGDGFSSPDQELAIEATRWEGDNQAAGPDGSTGTPAQDTSMTITLPWDVVGHSTKLELFDEEIGTDKPIAVAWIVDAGAVEWTLSNGHQQTVRYQNTAVVSQLDGGEVLHNIPRLPSNVIEGSDDERAFVRVVKLEGDASFGGRSSHELVVSNGGSHSRFSRGSIERVQLYPPTSTQQTWKDRVTNEDIDFTYDWEADPGGASFGLADEAAAVRDAQNLANNGELSTTFVETVVTVSNEEAS